MGHFLEIAYKVLFETNKPLSPKEIIDIGKLKGWLVTNGKTPEQSMKARLSIDILRKENDSFFVRTSAGKFGLREWLNYDNEYHAPRFKRSLLNEDIVVFPMRSLSKYISGPGIHTTPLENRKELIQELRPMQREQAENDFNVIQLVSAFIIKFGNKYLTYKRTKRLPESRLHGVYSIPFGGHLNPNDILPLFDIFDPKVANVVLTRELREEIILPKNQMPEIKYIGLLYDDRREVSLQHLGVVYYVIFQSSKFTIGERGFLTNSKFETLEQIEARIDEFENWSWLIVDYEKMKLKKND
jgi:predicted NUDIX family phosphoesterase